MRVFSGLGRLIAIVWTTLKIVWATLKIVARTIMILVFAGSLIMNGLLLFSSASSAAIGTAIQAVTGLQTVFLKNRTKVNKVRGKVRLRIARMAAVNTAALPLEFIPFAGAGIAAGATAWELQQSCEMFKELNELDELFGPSDENVNQEEGVDYDYKECLKTAQTSIADSLKDGAKGLQNYYDKLLNQGVKDIPSLDDVLEKKEDVITELNKYLWDRPKKWLENLLRGSG